MLHGITGLETYEINSIHGQGVDQPAERVSVEAVAPDGQIEAISVKGAPFLQLGVQWHPEWRFRERKPDHALFTAFGEACRAYGAARLSASAA